MHKCCTVNQTHRPRRRLHGLQFPLNYLQIIGWIAIVITGVLNFVVLVQIQCEKIKPIVEIIFAILYMAHMTSHLTASVLDPSEKELRKLQTNNVPEFDRNIHAHVIENGRCHLCNIFTTSKKTKHCSLCNKCVDRFDHHCKWLNSCVGHRNYKAFIASVITALLLSSMTSSLCLVNIVLFISDPYQLSSEAQDVINCTSIYNYTNIYSNVKFCTNSIILLIFLIVFFGSALAITCALIHLLCFHIYISVLGVSTYEYIIRNGASPQIRKCNFCNIELPGKLYVISKSKAYNNSKLDESSEEGPGVERLQNTPANNDDERNVASFIGVLVSNELNRARKMFIYDKNKIHPKDEHS